jgi:hypothetical protein
MLNYLIGTAADLQEFSVREFKIVIVYIYIYIYKQVKTSWNDKLKRIQEDLCCISQVYWESMKTNSLPDSFLRELVEFFPVENFSLSIKHS